jgi:hypothetical protein
VAAGVALAVRWSKLGAQLQRELSIATLPTTLDGYVTQLLEPTLARWQTAGAVAVKFLSAYTRSLDFQTGNADVAAAVYSRAASGAVLDSVQAKTAVRTRCCSKLR